MKYKIYTLLSLLMLMACVSEFNADIPLSGTDILVVEGNIVGNSTVNIYLSRSFGLDEENPPAGYDDISVEMVIIGDDGYKSAPAVYVGAGVHQFEVGDLNSGTAYGIEFKYDGDTYRSELSKPLLTPDIDEVSWFQPEELADVSIRVSTHNDNAGYSYYLWDYKEDWEVISDYSTIIFFEKDGSGFYLDDSAPLTYCWGTNKNREILVGTTETLVENRILNRKLFSVISSSDKFSYLYSVQVRQQAISKAAYEYYLDKAKSNTGMGGLFTPQPSAIEGNITCLTDVNKRVIGFIDVAHNITEQRLYISSGEISRKVNIGDCEDQDFSMLMAYPALGPFQALYAEGFRPVSYTYLSGKLFGNYWVRARCADCTTRNAGKNKPSFWPNDHQ